jgi:hypothetical protein
VSWQNGSYGKLQMVGDLRLSEYVYGFGASLFFLCVTLGALITFIVPAAIRR